MSGNTHFFQDQLWHSSQPLHHMSHEVLLLGRFHPGKWRAIRTILGVRIIVYTKGNVYSVYL